MASFFYHRYKKTEDYRVVNYELYGKPQQRIFSRKEKRFTSAKSFLTANGVNADYEPGVREVLKNPAQRNQVFLRVDIKFYVKNYLRKSKSGAEKYGKEVGTTGSFHAYRTQHHDFMTPSDVAFMVSNDEKMILESFNRDNEGQPIWGNAEVSIKGIEVIYKLNTPPQEENA